MLLSEINGLKDRYLFQEDLPLGLDVVRIKDGAAVMKNSRGDFEVKLILIPAPKDTDLGLGLKTEGSALIILRATSCNKRSTSQCLA